MRLGYTLRWSWIGDSMPHNKTMVTKLLTFSLSLAFLFSFSGFVYSEEPEVRRGYWDNGKLKSEVSFKNGKLEGKATAWYENGKKRNETHFKNGEVDGLLTDWYPSGKKWMELHHKNGILDGPATVWYKSGAKKSEARHKDGNTVYEKIFLDGAGKEY